MTVNMWTLGWVRLSRPGSVCWERRRDFEWAFESEDEMQVAMSNSWTSRSRELDGPNWHQFQLQRYVRTTYDVRRRVQSYSQTKAKVPKTTARPEACFLMQLRFTTYLRRQEEKKYKK